MGIKARLAERILPSKIYARLYWQRQHSVQRKYVTQNGLDKLGPELQHHFGNRVLHGPFAGMIYPVELASASSNSPKVLGSFEAQLSPFLVTDSYELFVDIGAAEGYFVVGMAFIGLNAVGFEIDTKQRQECMMMARANGVSERITLNGVCGPNDLAMLSGRRVLLLCDTDGFEARLFTSETIQLLRRSDCIVELHEDISPGVTKYLCDRFSLTHGVQLIDHIEKEVKDYPEASILGDRADLALCEHRPFQQWLIAKSKAPLLAT
jgi:hypothetical protein